MNISENIENIEKKNIEKKNKDILNQRGGKDLERLYIYNKLINNTNFLTTHIPGTDMNDVIIRHLGRYGFVLPFIRSGFKVLDFPCGSGIAVEVFSVIAKYGIGISYEGRDIDEETIVYANSIYGNSWAQFERGDLANFELKKGYYDTICCIEGIEHIDKNIQKIATKEFAKGLKEDGTFILTSPEPNNSELSGPNIDNNYHLWELTKEDLLELLKPYFDSIQIVSQKNLLTAGHISTCHYVVARNILGW